jgi:hypothetical protein
VRLILSSLSYDFIYISAQCSEEHANFFAQFLNEQGGKMIAPVSSLCGANLKTHLCCYTRSTSGLAREDMFGVMFAGKASFTKITLVIYENIKRALHNSAPIVGFDVFNTHVQSLFPRKHPRHFAQSTSSPKDYFRPPT